MVKLYTQSRLDQADEDWTGQRHGSRMVTKGFGRGKQENRMLWIWPFIAEALCYGATREIQEPFGRRSSQPPPGRDRCRDLLLQRR